MSELPIADGDHALLARFPHGDLLGFRPQSGAEQRSLWAPEPVGVAVRVRRELGESQGSFFIVLMYFVKNQREKNLR